MADTSVDPRYVPFTVTTPAGTLSTAPLVTAVPLTLCRLVEVTLQIPPGHAGQTGWRFEVSQQQVIPYSRDPSWVIGDGNVFVFECDQQVDQTVRIATYNVGQFDHTHLMRMKVRTVVAAPRAVSLLPIEGLTG